MRIGPCQKFVSISLSALLLITSATAAASAEPTNTTPTQPLFKYERYDAEGGALFGSRGEKSDFNNSVTGILVDSKGRVWVSTMTGLAVYDGKVWSSRTFKPAGMATRAVAAVFGNTDSGPDMIAEGPIGTIWLGGVFGIWHRNGRYEEINSEITSQLGMAVDQSGGLWVVTKYIAQRYDRKTWTTMLRPYFDRSIHLERPGLFGIAIATNGNVWIGGTVYIEPEPPWTHEGTIWVVDQSRKRRGDGPPMAPMFEFDAKNWRAFGRPHGLGMKMHDTAIPKVDGLGRITAKSREQYYLLDGGHWKPVNELEIFAGKRWILREPKKGFLPGYSKLLFRDGDKLIEVHATDHKTGKVLDLQSKQLVSLELLEDQRRGCIWLGTDDGLYRIWREEDSR
jgi:hypothetical protein